jgi:hypothetical protein
VDGPPACHNLIHLLLEIPLSLQENTKDYGGSIQNELDAILTAPRVESDIEAEKRPKCCRSGEFESLEEGEVMPQKM